MTPTERELPYKRHYATQSKEELVGHIAGMHVHNEDMVKRLADMAARVVKLERLLRDIEEQMDSKTTDFPSLGYDIECRMHEVLHDKP